MANLADISRNFILELTSCFYLVVRIFKNDTEMIGKAPSTKNGFAVDFDYLRGRGIRTGVQGTEGELILTVVVEQMLLRA